MPGVGARTTGGAATGLESTCVAKAGLVAESVGEGASVGTGISVGDESAFGIFESESVGEGASVGTAISVDDEDGNGISVESSGSSGWSHGVAHSHAGDAVVCAIRLQMAPSKSEAQPWSQASRLARHSREKSAR